MSAAVVSPVTPSVLDSVVAPVTPSVEDSVVAPLTPSVPVIDSPASAIDITVDESAALRNRRGAETA
jgi:hypothetical protein